MINYFREKFNNFISRQFVKDTAILQMGTIFMIGVSAITSVIFARLLLPEKYGIYNLAFTFAGLVSVFMNWGADKAALTLFSEAYENKDSQEIKNILAYFIKISAVIACIGLVGVIASPFLSLYFYGNSYIGELARLIILAGIFGIFFELILITVQVLRRIKDYAILDNFRNLLRVILGISLIFSLGVFGVILGYLIALFLSFIVAIIYYNYLASRYELLPSIKEIIFSQKGISIRKYFNFGFLIAINENISNLYGILPVFFLSLFFSVADVGFFNIAMKYVTLPLLLISPVSQLLSVRFPQMKIIDANFLRYNFFKVSIISGLIAFCLIIPTLIIGPFLIKLFYGASYLNSIPLIYYLAPFTVICGFAVGLGPIYRSLNKLSVAIIINSSVIILGAIPAYYLIKLKGIIGICIVSVGWSAISCFLLIIYMVFYFKKLSISQD